MIIQWGYQSIGAATTFAITFPISFSTTNYSFAEIDQAFAENAANTSYESKTISTFQGKCSNKAAHIIWMAIGY